MQTSPTGKTAPLQPKNRGDYVKHILMMKKTQPAYAEYIYSRYVKKLDWLDWPAWDALK